METISLTAREYAEQNGIALPTAYLWLKKGGLKPKAPEHGGQKTVGKYDKLLRQYRGQGLKYYEIAKILGKDRHYIQTRCKQLGLEYREDEKPKPEYKERVKTKGFEYISGYENRESIITIRCLKCGTVSQRKYKNILESPGCPVCQRDKRELKKKAREIEKQRRQQEIKKQKENAAQKKIKEAEERISNGKQMAFGSCPICGSLFYGNKKYCSKHCRIKQERRNRETTRRIRTSEGLIDKDITLEKLYIRDGGACYLCGRSCDWGDFTIKDENFIAGTTYPSIDHVKPLSKGGKHSWDNVKLAHFVCNSLKSDK